MKLELTIQKMFNDYPSLFKERADCLNHLFCTIGNGYDWENGELVDCGSICRAPEDVDKEELDFLQNQLLRGKAFQYYKMSLRDEVYEMIARERKREDFDEWLERLEMTKLQWAELALKNIEKAPPNVYYKIKDRKMRWYFFIGGYCKNFSYLWNYPKNIKEDWLAGIEETKALLMEDGYDLETPIDTIANLEEYKKAIRGRG